MRIKMLIAACCVTGMVEAQTVIDRTIDVTPAKSITMHFDYPELIKITTWDKNQISVHGTVSINGGENDEAFELMTSVTGDILNIRNQIKNIDDIPKLITITDGSNKVVFHSREAFNKYQQEHGRHFESSSCGVDMEIKLEIKVPRNIETRVESVYGMVEVKDFTGPLNVVSTYGGVDAALRETTIGELSAQTNYGAIYTNFTTRFGGKNIQDNFYTSVSAKPGTGPAYAFTSKYGNVYIRRSE